MYKKKLMLLIAGIIIGFSACQTSTTSKKTNPDQPNVHKGLVKEVLQTSNYTYLLVKEDATEQWVAIPAMQAKPGETYYYAGGLQMNKFQSKELNRMFESVVFLEGVSADPNAVKVSASKPVEHTTVASTATDTNNMTADNSSAGAGQYTRSVVPVEKKNVKIAPAKGGITVSDLFSKKDAYAGKTVKIKGEVTKFTPAVMNKNWIHIQDGTDYNGKYDMVITSDKEVKVGDKVIFEGKIALNKDLGYGYFFEVLMEDAVISQK
jgi:hypothetical protein